MPKKSGKYGLLQHSGVVDKEVTKVVEEVNKELVKEVTEGLVLVCRYSARRGNHKIGGGGAGQGG